MTKFGIDSRFVFEPDGTSVNKALSNVNNSLVQVNASLENKADKDELTKYYITPEDFGAKGDNIQDDTVFVQRAIEEASAQKKELHLSAGKVYWITSPLVVTAQTVIKGSPSHRPIIRVKSQDFSPLEVKGTYVGSTTMKASATVNTKWMDVNDASQIKPSMLVEVVSSLPWYHDPRTDSSDCRKAEVHRVDEVVDNRIYFTDPLFDGYDLTKESVTLYAYTPIRFHMEHVEIQMNRGTEPNDNIRKTGLTLKHTVDSMLDHVYITNAVNCGIHIYHSYRCTVEGGRTQSANNYFAGYGVQTYGSTHTVIRNRHARNCRRGFDVSGGRIPSHFTTVENCSVFANGLNSLLNRYSYNDNHTTGTAVYGMGTHGGADHTIFRNNTIGFVDVGINDRGRNTIIDNNYFVGDFRITCIDIIYGENFTITNNKTYDGYAGLKEKGVFDGGSNINTRKPQRFVMIRDGALNNANKGGFALIEGNFAMIQDRFISFSSNVTGADFPWQENFTVKNNHVLFYPQMQEEDCWLIKNDTQDSIMYIAKSTITDNTYKRMTGTLGSAGMYLISEGLEVRGGTETQSPKSFAFFLADDTAESVYIGARNAPFVRLMVDANGASGLIRVSLLSSAWSSVGTANGVEGNWIPLTGTTGTDGKITCSVVNGRLYVENRYGASQRVYVTVMNYV